MPIDIMTLGEVAQYLRLGERTIYKLVRDGEIPGRKIGRAWRFSRQKLDLWLEEGRYPSQEKENLS